MQALVLKQERKSSLHTGLPSRPDHHTAQRVFREVFISFLYDCDLRSQCMKTGRCKITSCESILRFNTTHFTFKWWMKRLYVIPAGRAPALIRRIHKRRYWRSFFDDHYTMTKGPLNYAGSLYGIMLNVNHGNHGSTLKFCSVVFVPQFHVLLGS